MTPRLQSQDGRRGFVLLTVLIVVMLAAMVAISLLFRMRAEETASAAGSSSEQAWSAALSGVQEAIRSARQAKPGMLDWQDNPAVFYDRFVFEDGADRWYFTVYSAGTSDTGELRYGLTDEASKLNVNTATEEMLGKLPSMTPSLVQALLDFLDTDDTPRPEGAEQEYYDALASPYKAFNGPLSTLDELLLVRGFTPQLLYGEDANLNFTLDPNEDDGDQSWPPDNSDGKLNAGLYPLLTVASYALDQDNAGVPRTNLNDPQDPINTNDLPAAVGAYILALRSNNITLTHAAELLEATTKVKDEAGKEAELASGVGKAELPLVLDRFSATPDLELPGLINLNTASQTVLQTVPGIDENLAGIIDTARKALTPEKRQTIAWLYTDDIVKAEDFKKLAPFFTARSWQYGFNVVGYGVPSGHYRVLQVVVDLAGEKPKTIYLRDLTRLGPPFRFETDTTGLGASKP